MILSEMGSEPEQDGESPNDLFVEPMLLLFTIMEFESAMLSLAPDGAMRWPF